MRWWAISFEPPSDKGRLSRVRCWLAAAALLVAASPSPATAKVFLTVPEALELAFPGCTVESRTVYLTEAQLERARHLAGVPIAGAMVRPYLARCDGEHRATAYFDSHRVRTLPETLMVVVGSDGRVERIEVLAFREPEDYIPRETWYGQFLGEELGEDLLLKRDIQGVTGATLTARSTTAAVRRILALDRVIRETSEE